MGWSLGYDGHWKRDIGYGVPATCDHPDCNEKIDRGLSYVCGADVRGGEEGCGLFFCAQHQVGAHQRCERCTWQGEPFAAKPDHPEWINWKLTDESWEEWRQHNPQAVEAMRAAMEGKAR